MLYRVRPRHSYQHSARWRPRSLDCCARRWLALVFITSLSDVTAAAAQGASRWLAVVVITSFDDVTPTWGAGTDHPAAFWPGWWFWLQSVEWCLWQRGLRGCSQGQGSCRRQTSALRSHTQGTLYLKEGKHFDVHVVKDKGRQFV